MNAFWGLVHDQLSRMSEDELPAATWMFSQLWMREYQKRYSPPAMVVSDLPTERRLLRLVQTEMTSAGLRRVAPASDPGGAPKLARQKHRKR